MLRKLSFIVLLSALPILSILAQQSETHLTYINRYSELAMREMERTGIPASIKLAQGILESDAGRSVLARRANNHFGIKCGGSWEGDTFYREDDDYDANGRLIKSCFRVYKNTEASYVAHSQFLMDPRKAFRYGFLFRLDPTDYQQWAYGLKQAGYATSPTYPEKLISLIERYELFRYDNGDALAGGDPTRPYPDTGPTTPTYPGTPLPGNNTGGNAGDDEFPIGIFDNNDVRYAVAGRGETVEDIARRTATSVRNLINYNEELDNDQQTVDPGQWVYLQPKRNSSRSRDKFHTVEAGQSMFDISQMYGVKLKKLLKRNRLNPGQEPAAGSQIKLRGWKVKDSPKLRGYEPDQPTNTAPTLPNGELEMEEEEVFEEEPPAPAPTPRPSTPVQPNTPNNGGGVIINPGSQPAPNQPVPPTTNPTPPSTTPSNPPVIQPGNQPSTTPNTGNATGNPQYHTVAAGETLYGISRRYGITVDALKSMNGLTSNNITPGMKLRVK